jgi:membrane-associated protein
MELLQLLTDLVLHLDKHIVTVFDALGPIAYGLMFLTIFCETGLVIASILPGDSLLFTAGTLAGQGTLNVIILYVGFLIAAVAGDTMNYAIGGWFGPHIFKRHSRWINQDHLLQTQAFFQRYGARTILIARFLPFIRTCAPFVAGATSMHYPTFLLCNCIGGTLWVTVFLLLGYFFGSIPAVQEHFSLVIVAIVCLSFVPITIGWVRARLANW